MQHSSKIRAAMLALALMSTPGLAAPLSPSKEQYTFEIKPHTATKPIPFPVVNQPVHMMVTVPVGTDVGLAEATIVRSTNTNAGKVLFWFACDWASGGCATGFGSGHIVYADVSRSSTFRLDGPADVRIVNNSTSSVVVILTFIW